jgi:hypothetical protein
MIIAVTAALLALLLFWFGFAQSHLVAPLAIFIEAAPVVVAVSGGLPPGHVAVHLVGTLALFYTTFVLGRWMADPVTLRADLRDLVTRGSGGPA